jgi:hypothetical protein
MEEGDASVAVAMSGVEKGKGSGKREVVMVDTPGGNNFGTVGGLPWLDSLVEGSRLGRLRTVKGRGSNRTGTVRVECKQQSEFFRPFCGCLGSHFAPETAHLLPNTSRNTPKRNTTADIVGRGGC